MKAHAILPFVSAEEVARAIPEAILHLRAGGVLGHPTETIYGLGSSTEKLGLKNLVNLKGDRRSKPFLLLVAGREMLGEFGLSLEGGALALARKHWPGPLTLILNGGDGRTPAALRNERGGVAVRWTSHPGLAKLIFEFGRPITSSSANHAGETPSRSGTQLAERWPEELAAGVLKVLDAATLIPSLPSTIIDCTESPPRVTREGALSASVLRQTLSELVGHS